MSSFGVDLRHGPQNKDYDAAQALLDLQSNKKQEPIPAPRGWRDLDSKEGIEKAAKLILNCFIAADDSENINSNTIIPFTPNKLKQIGKIENHGNKTTRSHRVSSRRALNDMDFRTSSSRAINTDFDMMYPVQSFKKERTSTRDIGTQTEEQYLNPNIELVESTIKSLCDRIKNLETQVKMNQSKYADQTEDEASIATVRQDFDIAYEDNDNDPDFEMSLKNDSDVNESKHSFDFKNPTHKYRRSRQTNQYVVYNGILTNRAGNSYEKVPIGEGHASVPSRLLKNINWNSYSSATRKLLTAVFSRRILATHSLTGKPSPAFPDKPAKKRLNPALINDIIQTVVERCRVPENVVRTSITTKCADESKMFRTREKNKKKKSHKKYRENIPPTSDSDFDDY